MRFAEYFRPGDAAARRLLRQCGVEHAVLRLPEADEPAPRVDLDRLARLRAEWAEEGLTLAVIEPVPPMEAVKQGLAGRDDELARLCALVTAMGELGIGTLCYNFMAVFGWLRTEFAVPARGGALVTAYDHDAHERLGPAPEGPIDDERMWANYTAFLDAVLPVAERAGVRLALHPDDPPISPIRGIARIMRSPGAIDRVLALSDSPSHGLTFCQGTFATMGVDVPATIRRLGDRIAYVHFRDVRGTPARFAETFQDDGPTDMWAAMRAYAAIGFDGPVRTDHVPTLHGETNERPGYELVGRLFAVGYLRGLAEAAYADLPHPHRP